jgi:hypothetical protein
MALVLDGHESRSTSRRSCFGCLSRNVAAILLGKDFPTLPGAEPQGPGEDEIASAIRLLERVLQRYPRAFDVVVGDSLSPPLLKRIRTRARSALSSSATWPNRARATDANLLSAMTARKTLSPTPKRAIVANRCSRGIREVVSVL